MRAVTPLMAFLLLLAACGADGPPTPPAPAGEPAAGLSLTGQVKVGVAGGL